MNWCIAIATMFSAGVIGFLLGYYVVGPWLDRRIDQ